MEKRRRIDWLRVAVHGFFGLILGAIAGYTFAFFLGFFVQLNELWGAGVGAAVYAVVAAVKGDEFWGEFGT